MEVVTTFHAHQEIEMDETSSPLTGFWIRVSDSPCSHAYPKQIQFLKNGMYSAAGSYGGSAPGWDQGTYQIQSSQLVKISTMNDAIIAYHFTIDGDFLTFIDPWQCEVIYTRSHSGENTVIDEGGDDRGLDRY